MISLVLIHWCNRFSFFYLRPYKSIYMKKQAIVIFLSLVWLSCSANAKTNNPPKKNPNGQKTYALIIGVLEWSDQYLPPFEKKNRKDEELYNLLKATDVEEANILFLKDDQATLKNIKSNMKSLLDKTESGSHFIFYYAGHGIKEKDKYYFANSDINTTACSESGLDFDLVGELITKNFKGERVTLWADCCYSGALTFTAEAISKKGFKTFALTSATNTNTSTANWTYSQTLIDCLRGNAVNDPDRNGNITMNELAKEVKDAMKYRERQLNGFAMYNLDGDKTIFSHVSGKVNPDSEIGSYVFAMHGGKWKVARITGKTNGEYDCEFYFYSDKESKTLPSSKTRKPHFITYKIGTKVKIEYKKQWYAATIVKADGDFYYVTYDGYDNRYNEWVLYDRIRTGTEKQVQVLWEGQYYAADLLETNGTKSYVHYTEFDYTWDEWTDSKNIK